MPARFAPAKVNLALHVTGRRVDGYHEIDTLVAFADVGDTIAATPLSGDRIELACGGPFAASLPMEPADNLVLRAAAALREAANAAGLATAGARIELAKNLPVASGIGGGSADAAATLLALRDLWRLPTKLDLAGVALRLGADVPMCLVGKPLRARGVGERIEVLSGAKPLPCVLLNPGVAVSTAEAFATLENRNHPPIGDLPDNPFAPGFLAGLSNDLEPAAMRLQPQIGEALAFLAACEGALSARMSGSGATCFTIFATTAQAQAAARRAIDTHPGWWCAAAVLGDGSRDGKAAT